MVKVAVRNRRLKKIGGFGVEDTNCEIQCEGKYEIRQKYWLIGNTAAVDFGSELMVTFKCLKEKSYSNRMNIDR